MHLKLFTVKVYEKGNNSIIYMTTECGFTEEEAIKKVSDKFSTQEWDRKLNRFNYPLQFIAAETQNW